MLPTTITRSCAITICRGQSTNYWRKVTEFVITKGQTNGTLPNYVHLGATICLNCYNGIVTRSSAIFQQHAQTNTKQPETDEIDEAIENTDEIKSTNSLSFSKAIEMITNMLYTRENKEKEPILYTDIQEFQIY